MCVCVCIFIFTDEFQMTDYYEMDASKAFCVASADCDHFLTETLKHMGLTNEEMLACKSYVTIHYEIGGYSMVFCQILIHTYMY